jgi:hemerythrin-like domain-containing protein
MENLLLISVKDTRGPLREDEFKERVRIVSVAGVLTEHIKKEDEILYPWMDRNLSTRQVGEMFARFREVDERFQEAQEKFESFVGTLEETFLAQSAEVSR